MPSGIISLLTNCRVARPGVRSESPLKARHARRTASRGLRRLQSEPRLDLLTHHELLDLAGDRHGKFVDEFDVAGNLVVRDLSLTERADLVGRERLARARPDPCAELLAVAGVSDPENLNIQNLRMTIEEFLDFSGIEILAATDHHVLDAADDVAIALGIDHGDVAGVHPPLRVEHVGGLFPLIPIAQHDAVATGT